jgi:cytochrome P450
VRAAFGRPDCIERCFDAYAVLRAEAPVRTTPTGYTVFSRYEDCHEILESHEGDRLTEEELLYTLVLILGGGHQTSVSLLYLLLMRPEALETARTQPDSLGVGVHHCLGAALGTTEAVVALGTLLPRLPGLRLVDEPAYDGLYNLRGLASLQIAWDADQTATIPAAQLEST